MGFLGLMIAVCSASALFPRRETEVVGCGTVGVVVLILSSLSIVN